MLYPLPGLEMGPMAAMMAPHMFYSRLNFTGNRDYDEMLSMLLFTGDAILVVGLVYGAFIGIDQLNKKVIAPLVYRPDFRGLQKALRSDRTDLKHTSIMTKATMAVSEEASLVQKALFNEDVISAYEKLSKPEVLRNILSSLREAPSLVVAAALERLGYSSQVHDFEQIARSLDFSQFKFDRADSAAFAVSTAEILSEALRKSDLDKVRKDIEKLHNYAKSKNVHLYRAYRELEDNLTELSKVVDEVFPEASLEVERYFLVDFLGQVELDSDYDISANRLLESSGTDLETASMLRELKVNLAQQQLEHFLTENSNIYAVQADYTFGSSRRKGAGIVLVSRGAVDKEHLERFKKSEISLSQAVQSLSIDKLARTELLIRAMREINELSRENSPRDTMRKLQLKMTDTSFSDEIVNKVRSTEYRQQLQRELETLAEKKFGADWQEKIKSSENFHALVGFYVRSQLEQRIDLGEILSNPTTSSAAEHLLNMLDHDIFQDREFNKARKHGYSNTHSTAVLDSVTKSILKGKLFGGQLSVPLESKLRDLHYAEARKYLDKYQNVLESEVVVPKDALDKITKDAKDKSGDSYLQYCFTELGKIDYLIEKFMDSRNITAAAKAVFSHDAEIFESLRSRDISSTSLVYLDVNKHEVELAARLRAAGSSEFQKLRDKLTLEDLQQVREGHVEEVLKKHSLQSLLNIKDIEVSESDYESAIHLKSKFSVSELSNLVAADSADNVRSSSAAIRDLHSAAYQLFVESHTTAPRAKAEGLIDYSADLDKLRQFVIDDSARLVAETHSKEYAQHAGASAVMNELKAITQTKSYVDDILAFNGNSEHSRQSHLKLAAAVNFDQTAEILSKALRAQVQFQQEAKRVYDFYMTSESDYRGFKKASRAVKKMRKKFMKQAFEVAGKKVTMTQASKVGEAFVDAVRAQTKDEYLNIREAMKASLYIDGDSDLVYAEGLRSFSTSCFSHSSLSKSGYHPSLTPEVLELAATFKESTGASFQDFSAVSESHWQVLEKSRDLLDRAYMPGINTKETAAMLDYLDTSIDRVLEIESPENTKHALAKEPRRYSAEALQRLSYKHAKVPASRPPIKEKDDSLRYTLASMIESRMPRHKVSTL